MNKQAKQLLQKLWDHIFDYYEGNGYHTVGLILTKEEYNTLDKLVHAPDKPKEKTPWISCAKEPNGIVKLTEIEALDTSDTNFHLKDKGQFKILFQISGEGVTWFFDDKKRRNEVYTKIHNRLHPQEL